MEIKKIKERLFSIEEGYVRCFCIEGDHAVLLVDTGVEKGLRKKIETFTNKPIQVVLTHGDRDHTAAIEEFEEIIVHPNEIAYLKEKEAVQRTWRWVEEGDILDLDPIKLEVIALPGHTPGSIALLEKKQRFLIGGDSIQNHPVFMFGQGRNVKQYQESLRKLNAKKDSFDVIYSSHALLEVEPSTIEDAIELCDQVLHNQLEGDIVTDRFEGTVKQFNWKKASMYFKEED